MRTNLVSEVLRVSTLSELDVTKANDFKRIWTVVKSILDEGPTIDDVFAGLPALSDLGGRQTTHYTYLESPSSSEFYYEAMAAIFCAVQVLDETFDLADPRNKEIAEQRPGQKFISAGTALGDYFESCKGAGNHYHGYGIFNDNNHFIGRLANQIRFRNAETRLDILRSVLSVRYNGNLYDRRADQGSRRRFPKIYGIDPSVTFWLAFAIGNLHHQPEHFAKVAEFVYDEQHAFSEWNTGNPEIKMIHAILVSIFKSGGLIISDPRTSDGIAGDVLDWCSVIHRVIVKRIISAKAEAYRFTHPNKMNVSLANVPHIPFFQTVVKLATDSINADPDKHRDGMLQYERNRIIANLDQYTGHLLEDTAVEFVNMATKGIKEMSFASARGILAAILDVAFSFTTITYECQTSVTELFRDVFERVEDIDELLTMKETVLSMLSERVVAHVDKKCETGELLVAKINLAADMRLMKL